MVVQETSLAALRELLYFSRFVPVPNAGWGVRDDDLLGPTVRQA